jgi:hypothetical protein
MTLIYREVSETGEITEREYTPAEVAESEKAYQEGLKKQALIEKRVADKAAAIEKLAALGLTADEAKLLLG